MRTFDTNSHPYLETLTGIQVQLEYKHCVNKKGRETANPDIEKLDPETFTTI